MHTKQKLNNEEFVINNLLTDIENNFYINKQLAVTCVTGSNLNQNKNMNYDKAITESENIINKVKKEYKLNDEKSYVIVYELKTNIIKGMTPYGCNAAPLCFGSLIKKPKKEQTQEETNELLTKIYKNYLQNLVIGEFLKYYNTQNNKIENEALDSIEFKQLKQDPDNIVIKAKIKLKDLKQPLQNVIKSRKKDINYNAIAPTPLSYISLDNKECVNLIFSLY